MVETYHENRWKDNHERPAPGKICSYGKMINVGFMRIALELFLIYADSLGLKIRAIMLTVFSLS